jgi:hypothetical protein
MAIETAFENLQRRLEKLKEEVGELRVNAEDFYPPSQTGQGKNGHAVGQPPPPVVALADRATDLEGEIEAALQATKKAVRAVRHPRNLPEVQRAMTAIQQSLNRALRQQLVEVAAFAPVQSLMQMAREKGDGWPKWTELIKSVMDGCRDHLLQAFEALAECWQELAEKLSANSVLIQSTNIGQHITAPEPLPSSVQGFT